MTHKQLFFLASLSLIIGISGSILNRQGISIIEENYTTYAYRVAIVIFIFIQLLNGSFKDKSRNRKVLQGFIAIFIVAILFKILHWEGTHLLLGISMIGTAVFYSLHFFRKHEKDYRDYLKLAFSWTFMLVFWLKLDIKFIQSNCFGPPIYSWQFLVLNLPSMIYSKQKPLSLILKKAY